MNGPWNARWWSRRRRRSAPGLLVAAALIVVAAPAGAQNLIVNGTFDHDASGWTAQNANIQVLFRADAGNTLSGGSGPGSMELHQPDWTGGGMGAYQDVQVTPGVTYTLTGAAFIPDTPANDGVTVDYFVGWYNSLGGQFDFEYAGLWPIEKGTWLTVSKDLTPPEGAVKARVKALIYTVDDPSRTEPAVAYFDDITFAEQGASGAKQVLFVPASASAHGFNGTFWTTTGWFASNVSAPVEIKAAFLRQGQDNSAALGSLTDLGTVPAGGYLEVEDMVAKLGGAGKTGGIYIEATAQGNGLPVDLVRATTYTFTPNDKGPGGYGQGVPAVGIGAGTYARTLIPGVYQGSDYRTNIGAMNTAGQETGVHVEVHDSTGTEVASQVWDLKPYEQKQVSLKSMGVTSLSGGFVTVTQSGTTGSFQAYVTVVDQKTGDAVYTSHIFTGDTASASAPGRGSAEAKQMLFVPASASAHGFNGTFWTTTGWFASNVSVPVTIKAAFLGQGQDNTAALGSLTDLGTVPAGGYLEVEDMVAKLGGAGKSGGMYIEATAQGTGLPAVLVGATTYTFTPNDQGPGGYGQGVPAVGAGSKADVLIPGVYQGADYRTNVGVVNTSGVQVDVTVAISGAGGSQLASQVWSLKPYEQKQVSVTSMGVNSASGGFVSVTQTGTNGTFLAYATVVDQKTGDAVYTPGL